MNDMLRTILEKQRVRVESCKRSLSATDLLDGIEPRRDTRRFQNALRSSPQTAIIAEIKRASPSAGLLRPGFDLTAIAEEYECHGAAAISVLTEEDFFLGSLEHLSAVRKRVRVPLLRKDFIIDPYQIAEARAAGADAVLLIAAVLDGTQLADFIQTAEALGLEALVEAHTQAEVKRALGAGAHIIGINNRDLNTFSVTLKTSFDLIREIPKDKVSVSESGIQSAADIAQLRQAGYDAFLIGERFMRADHPGRMLQELIQGVER